MIAIIDYGMGNQGSIQNIIKSLGYDSIIISNYRELENANKIILPGVGSFDEGMKNLRKSKLDVVLNEKVLKEKVPILGICLGMQLMTKSSEEGNEDGLGWINAEVLSFENKINLDIPHMGWNNIYPTTDGKVVSYTSEKEIERFYFVHSYFVECYEEENITSYTNYGLKFTSSFQKENIFGTQFHPEKSHKFGKKLFENFLEL